MTTYGDFDIDSLPAPHNLELAAIDAEREAAEMERREMMAAESREWAESALSSLQCANEEWDNGHRDLGAEWYVQARTEALVSIALSLATLAEPARDIAADLRAIRLIGTRAGAVLRDG